MDDSFVGREIARRIGILRIARDVTFRPSHFAAEMASQPAPDLTTAFKVFSAAVGIVITLETIFSFAFDTAFSDIVHHSFPILIALLGSVTVFVLVKLIGAKTARFAPTVAFTLLVGSGALVVMISTVLLLLTGDFLLSYEDVRNSPCQVRTITCLASGGSLIDYDIPRAASPLLGISFTFILLVMLISAIHYTRSLAKLLAATQGVARWRTNIAMAASIILLAPVSLFAVNTVYRALYG